MIEMVGPDNVHDSSSMELMIESVFLGELLQECWFSRRHLVDVLHSTVDSNGYDVVLQANGITRHVQLKARRKGGSTKEWKISSRLGLQPAGCVVLIEWEEDSPRHRMNLNYRWFGDAPNRPLPDLGFRRAKHTKGDATGEKAVRKEHYKVGIGKFRLVGDMNELANLMFGPADEVNLA